MIFNHRLYGSKTDSYILIDKEQDNDKLGILKARKMRLRKSKNEKNRQREKCFYIEKLKIYLK